MTQVSYSHSAIHSRKYILRSDKDNNHFLIYNLVVPFEFRTLSLGVAEDITVVLLKLTALVQTKAFNLQITAFKGTVTFKCEDLFFVLSSWNHIDDGKVNCCNEHTEKVSSAIL